MNKTAIEWCDYTWNPVVGCLHGCPYCYARRMAERGLGECGQYVKGQRFNPRFFDERLDDPKRLKKPARIFAVSMGDLFGEWVPQEWIDKVLATVRACPQHTFIFLTKNPARYAEVDFPANAWVGTTVESQAEANERIPLLLQTPAAVKFVSLEPLLGPVNLSAWVPSITPMRVEDAPHIWADFRWPEWVPNEVRKQIEEFWAEAWGRGPRAWMEDVRQQGAPPFGREVTLRVSGEQDETAKGRYVHAWNNMGRLITEDGQEICVYLVRNYRPPLDWLIVGAETGPGARPCDPAWVQSLIDQARAASVPVFVKGTMAERFPIQEYPEVTP